MGFGEDFSRNPGTFQKVGSEPMPALVPIDTLSSVKYRQETVEEFLGRNKSCADVAPCCRRPGIRVLGLEYAANAGCLIANSAIGCDVRELPVVETRSLHG
jgi:hypothetical protein